MDRNRRLSESSSSMTSALIRWSLVETLSDSGYEVIAVTDAERAVQVVTDAAVPFDVALLDFRLPDSDDLSLLSRLRRLAPAIPRHSHDRVRHAGDLHKRHSTWAPTAFSISRSR